MREKSRDFPEVSEPASVRTLRIWHCKYRTLAPVARLVRVEGAELATFPDQTLEPLGGLTALRYLHVLHLPGVGDLSPLANLTSLATLRLATLPSWDASGRTQLVQSLAPLASLPNLRHVELFGVVPRDGSLAPLERCQSLISARVSKFPKEETDRFYAAIAISDDFAPAADF